MQNITLRDFITKKSVTVVKLNLIMAFISGIKMLPNDIQSYFSVCFLGLPIRPIAAMYLFMFIKET